jgi:hypothetical protein
MFTMMMIYRKVYRYSVYLYYNTERLCGVVRELLCSKLGPKTGYPNWRFSLGKYPKTRPQQLPCTDVLFVIHLPALHSTLCNQRYWKASLNEAQTNILLQRSDRACGSRQVLLQEVQGSATGVKRRERETEQSPPFNVGVKEYVELYLHCSYFFVAWF